jgi:MbtH protein
MTTETGEVALSVFDDPERTFDVVLNVEEQYSIWPEGWDLPDGWERTGFHGRRDACLDHIESVWVDMRPASVRRWMDGHES